jgi:hypothetical protein
MPIELGRPPSVPRGAGQCARARRIGCGQEIRPQAGRDSHGMDPWPPPPPGRISAADRRRARVARRLEPPPPGRSRAASNGRPCGDAKTPATRDRLPVAVTPFQIARAHCAGLSRGERAYRQLNRVIHVSGASRDGPLADGVSWPRVWPPGLESPVRGHVRAALEAARGKAPRAKGPETQGPREPRPPARARAERPRREPGKHFGGNGLRLSVIVPGPCPMPFPHATGRAGVALPRALACCRGRGFPRSCC